MSVFIRPDTKDATHSYRFQLGGRQFSGNTGKTNRREAEKIEEERREEARALLAADAALFGSELTLEQAAARWWHEKGQHRSDAERCKWSLAWLIDHFGRSIMLQDITDSQIAAMVAKRRGEFDQRCTKNGEKRLVGPATVNRTVTEPLRQVILRARDVWEVRTANIKWRKHFLKEPQERVREASVAEEAAIISKLSRGYDTAIRFAFLTGCRKKEILGLEWTDVSFTGRCFTVVGKGNRKRTIPMSKAIYALLWGEQGNHPKKVFTFISSMTRRGRGMVYEKGKRYPLSNEGFASAMERAVADAGVTDFRLHDTRHTTATRIARKSNLKVAQKLLGHSDIRMTLRYVHAMQDDVRDALEAISRTENCTETEVKAVKD